MNCRFVVDNKAVNFLMFSFYFFNISAPNAIAVCWREGVQCVQFRGIWPTCNNRIINKTFEALCF